MEKQFSLFIKFIDKKKNKRPNKYEKAINTIDKNMFSERVERLKYIDLYLRNRIVAGSYEGVGIFEEAGWSYINGQYIATILLAQALIERILCDELIVRGYEKEAKEGLDYIIIFCKNNGIINGFLLDKIRNLKNIRNSLAHKKKMIIHFQYFKELFIKVMRQILL